MSKKICIFSVQYLPSTYGVEKYTYNLAKELSEKNVEVTIVTSDIYEADKFEKNGNITVYRVPSYGLMNNRLPIIRYNRQFRNIMKDIAKTKYDLCITNTRFYTLSLIGAKFGKKHAKRNILIEHGTAHIEMSNALMKFCGEIYEHILTMLIKWNVKEFYGVSKDCNKWLEHFGIQAKGVLHNAINIDEIDSICSSKNKKIINVSVDTILISFTGRLMEEKGVLQLVKAFGQIERKYPNLRLAIAGDGPLMMQLKEMCDEKVFLLGRIPFEDVVGLLQQSDIFCFPSVYAEGMPTSILEAAACENSIISTRCGGAAEIIPDDMHGIILKDNSEEQLLVALEKLIKDKKYRRSTAQNIRKHVEKHFVWERIAEKVSKEFLGE